MDRERTCSWRERESNGGIEIERERECDREGRESKCDREREEVGPP